MRTNLLIAAILIAPLAGIPIARAAGETGFLNVNSTPLAHVSVDGKDTGRTTPVVRFELPAGHHQLTLISLDCKLTRTLGITITPTETTRLRVNLGP
jgi:hypothetical protein